MERNSDRRRLPPLNALRAFESAARHLNFSRAAEATAHEEALRAIDNGAGI